METHEEMTLSQIIETTYYPGTLRYFYRTYFEELEKSHPKLFAFSPKRKGAPSKKYISECFATVLGNQELLKGFYAKLPGPVQSLLLMTVWMGPVPLHAFQEQMDISLWPKDLQRWQCQEENMLPDYQLFQVMAPNLSFYPQSFQGMFLTIPRELRPVLKEFLEKPDNYDLHPVKKLPNFSFQNHEGNGPQLLEMARLAVETKQVRFYSNSNRILKSSLKQFAEGAAVSEFFPSSDWDFPYLKSNLLLEAVSSIKLKKKPADALSFSKDLAHWFFNKDSFPLLDFFQDHLNGNESYRFHNEFDDHEYDDNAERAAAHILRNSMMSLPPNQWISWENLQDYLFYRELLTQEEVFLNRYGYRYLIFHNPYEFSNKIELDESNIHPLLIQPLQKGAFFLFAALGWVDICYTLPKNPDFYRRDKDYLTPYDGLTHVRITKLGMYVMGRDSSYEDLAPASPEGEVILDPERLLVTLKGEIPAAQMLLTQMGVLVGVNRYRVDFGSFLKPCRTATEVRNQVEAFRRVLRQKLPENWEAFFETVLHRVGPLTRRSQWEIFQVANNSELMHLVSTDPVLKKYVLKAEQLHVLIDRSHLKKVIKRLEELGYLWDESSESN